MADLRDRDQPQVSHAPDSRETKYWRPVDPLLVTRIRVPPARSGTFARPRLSKALGDLSGARCILVSAPAGFGKTTLLADWCRSLTRESDVVAAWYSLEEGDNDPLRFGAYLAESLHQALGERMNLGATREAIRSGRGESLERSTTLMLNELAALETRCVLVLDDFHLIHSPVIHSGVGSLADHLPEQVTLAIGTRADPPLQLSLLRVRNQLVDVRAADLRFTLDEAIELVRGSTGVALSPVEARALDEITEGWAAGIQLVTLEIRQLLARGGRVDVDGLAARLLGAHGDVFDFLASEVFDEQSPEIRRFLLDTGVLEGLAAPLCDAVTGRADSALMLDLLDRADLFVSPLDEEHTWYRYHVLFGQFLQDRLRLEEPEKAVRILRVAAAWHERVGQIGVAVRYLLEAGDVDQAAALIETHADETWLGGNVRDLLSWLDSLPPESLGRRPRLHVYRALMLLHDYKLDEADASLDLAEAGLCALEQADRPGTGTSPSGPSGQWTAETEGMIHLLRAAIAINRTDTLPAIEHAERALVRLNQSSLTWLGLSAATLGTAQGSAGNSALSRRAFEAARTLTRDSENQALFLMATHHLALFHLLQGELGQAALAYEEIAHLEGHGGTGWLYGPGEAYAEYAMLLYERNEIEAAEGYASRCMRIGRQTESPAIQALGLLATARVRQARGDLDGALQDVEVATKVAAEHEVALVQGAAEARLAHLSLARGEVTGASSWARRSGLSPQSCSGERLNPPPHPFEFEPVTLARVLIAERRAEEAIELLHRLLVAADSMGRLGRAAEILVLTAVAEHASGRVSRALASLGRALDISRAEGFVRVFLNEGWAMVTLLQHSVARGIEAEYACRLLEELEGELARLGIPPSPESQGLVEALTPRELEVLRLVGAGASNQAVADALVIAVPTVKAHLNHILGKLDARNRIEAVSRARDLGLLG